jgi:hypothetical protein
MRIEVSSFDHNGVRRGAMTGHIAEAALASYGVTPEQMRELREGRGVTVVKGGISRDLTPHRSA